MSVIVTIQVDGQPQKLEEFASANPDVLSEIRKAAESHGVIAHRFYGSDGKILVIDEWPDAESFQQFFDETQGPVGSLMQHAGVTSPPQVSFWQKLDTNDDIGWDA